MESGQTDRELEYKLQAEVSHDSAFDKANESVALVFHLAKMDLEINSYIYVLCK